MRSPTRGKRFGQLETRFQPESSTRRRPISLNERLLVRAAAGLGIVACLAVVGSVFLPWVGSGAGSTLAGYELANTVIAMRGVLDVPVWVATLWYFVPLGAATAVVAMVFGEGRARWISAIACAVSLITSLTAVGLFSRLGLQVGPGLVAAAIGSFVATASTVIRATSGTRRVVRSTRS